MNTSIFQTAGGSTTQGLSAGTTKPSGGNNII